MQFGVIKQLTRACYLQIALEIILLPSTNVFSHFNESVGSHVSDGIYLENKQNKIAGFATEDFLSMLIDEAYIIRNIR